MNITPVFILLLGICYGTGEHDHSHERYVDLKVNCHTNAFLKYMKEKDFWCQGLGCTLKVHKVEDNESILMVKEGNKKNKKMIYYDCVGKTKGKKKSYTEKQFGYKKNKTRKPPKVQNNKKKPEVVDVLIVGGGVGGTYSGREILKKYPDKKVVVLEASDHVGGRLHSEDECPAAKVKHEFGGMRVFPSVHQDVVALLNEAELTLFPLELGDSNNLFHLHGKSVRKKDAVYEGEGPYQGRHIYDIVDEAKKNFKKSRGGHEPEDPFLDEEMQNISLQEFIMKYSGCNYEEFDTYISYSGYNVFPIEHQVAIFMNEEKLLGADIKYHWFVREGYEALVEYMGEGLDMRFNHKVTSMKKDKNGVYTVTCEDGYKFQSKVVFMGITKPELLNVDGFLESITEEKKKGVYAVDDLPLFKIFMEYEHAWWKDAGFTNGKSTTAGDNRQMHYYDDFNILVYNSDDYARIWDTKMRYNYLEAVQEIHAGIVEAHKDFVDFEIPDPIWDSCEYKYWDDGSHNWLKGYNARDMIKAVTDGRKDGIYIVGDTYCDQQGWVQGAIDAIRIALAFYDETQEAEVGRFYTHELIRQKPNIGFREVTVFGFGMIFAYCVKAYYNRNKSEVQIELLNEEI